MFSYMPLIPQLYAFMSNRLYATCLQYCAEKHPSTCVPGKMTDIFDGLHYLKLLREHVVVEDQRLPYTYFSNRYDIALSFATNGFALFKNWKQTVWILFIFNYNLPLDKCFQKDNILCVGIIPSPKRPWDVDSFILPLVDELLELVVGVSTYDALSCSFFSLYAYLITAFGNIPTVSMLMHMKGHNSLSPC
jgi:hypothetical protein